MQDMDYRRIYSMKMRKNFIGACLIAALLFVSSAFTSLAEFGPTIIDTTGPVTSAPSGDDAKA